MSDKLQVVSEVVFGRRQAESPRHGPPLSAWLRHMQLQSGRSNSEDPKNATNFVFWFLKTLPRARAPYSWPLPPDLVEWLDAPEKDLTPYIDSAPGLYGSRPLPLPKILSRFMSEAWKDGGKQHDIQQQTGFYSFLAQYAFELLPAWRLSPALIPANSLAILNSPAGPADVPLTIGMLVYWKSRNPDAGRRLDLNRYTDLLACCCEALTLTLATGNVGLIPEFVSAFWSRSPLQHPALTAYEYVAMAAKPETRKRTDGSGRDDKAIRRAFIDSVTAALPLAGLFSGPVIEDHPPVEPAVTKRPVSQAIVLYRDQQTDSGLRRTGQTAANALAECGVPVVDLDFALERDRMFAEAALNRGRSVNSKRSIHIFNINPEYVPECVVTHLHRIQKLDYFIGQFHWELSSVSRIHECGIGLMDEIWVASEYLADICRRHTARPVINMKQAVNIPSWPSSYRKATFGIDSDDYTFFFAFDSGSVVECKNPLGAVIAFERAFPRGDERAAIVLKTENTRLIQTPADQAHWHKVLKYAAADKRIHIIDKSLPVEALQGLFWLCDCYVSLHRSEGFGFGPAEAMSCGKPVIVTGYSGVLDFCSERTAKLVDYELKDVKPGEHPCWDPERSYQWADPNLDMAASHMAALCESPDSGKALGSAGRELMADEFTMEALSRRYRARLREIGLS